MKKPMEACYEVFLSFRGTDTRRDLTDYLYHSLIDAGIRAYIDNEELRVGEEIHSELLEAIKQSKISIPIFSKEYAASPWCLMELVQMVQCMEKCGQNIKPIFYDVEPSEVRHQTTRYGEAINSHIQKGRYTDETIQNWKAALSKVGALKGWELKESGKGEFTKEVVRHLLIELKKNYIAEPNFLVERDDQVDKIMELIGEQTTATKIVGIHGMGGVGKTTLAKTVYNKLLEDSTNCCFLSNIRHEKIENLQIQLISDILRMKCLSITNINDGVNEIKKRLSSKRVILVLDDVDQKTQLDALMGVGEHWFGSGSKVIITTRDTKLLKDVDFQHELTEMDFDRSLQLFSRHAFRRDHPPAEYDSLSKKAVKICGCLPLSLEIIGSLLAGKDRKFWEDTLERLKTIPNKTVKSKSNISFKALEPREKEIFLDICCFFVGFDVRIVTYMWDGCKFFPEYSLEVLKQMSLIKIAEGNRFWVHDQLRDLGRDIVRERANFKPEKQSRVWDHEEVIDVLKRKEGIENVEALRLKFDHQSQCFFKKEEFANLSNLRFLQVYGHLDMNNVQHFPSTNRFQRNLLILPNLRYLSWHKFPLFFQFTTLSLKKLVILDLSRSEITDDWEGWNHLKMAKNLKVLNLTRCENLRGTPDFSSHEKLEQLILEGCEGLVQIDRSISELKNLVFLNLKYCKNLRTLPDGMEELEALTELLVDGTSITKIPELKGMKKLETLSAIGCRSLSMCNLAGCSTSLAHLRLNGTKITELPFGNFGSLVELDISKSGIRELPDSVETMKNLRVLRVSNTSLIVLPSVLGQLEKLEEIDASCCKFEKIPSEIGRLSFLRILRLQSTRILEVCKLPESLTELSLTTAAPSLQWISGLRKLESLQLDCWGIATLPSDFNLLSKLTKLTLFVDGLECLPRLPGNLSHLRIRAPSLMEESLDLSHLEKLKLLEVDGCEQLIEIKGLERLKNLNYLHLVCLPLVKLPDLTDLKKLQTLKIYCCPDLVEIRGQLESLEDLSIEYCESLEKWHDSFSFKNIDSLHLRGCQKLNEVPCLEDLEQLRSLTIGDLPLLEELPDLTNLKKLRELSLLSCPRLVELRGRLESLVGLHIDGCGSLRKVSDPSSFKMLSRLRINECEEFEKTLESDEYRGWKKVMQQSDQMRWVYYLKGGCMDREECEEWEEYEKSEENARYARSWRNARSRRRMREVGGESDENRDLKKV